MGVVLRWRWQHADKRRGLAEGQLVQVFAVVGLRGCGNAHAAMPETGHIEIDGKDLLLAEIPLHAIGDEYLRQLAPRGLFQRQEHVARGLLGDGAATLAGGIHRDHIGHQRTRHPHPVDAMVLEEAVVLGRQHGLADDIGNLFVGDRDAALLADLRNQPPRAGVHPQGHGLCILGSRQRRGEVDEGAGKGETTQQQQAGQSQGNGAEPAKRGRVHGIETLSLRCGGVWRSFQPWDVWTMPWVELTGLWPASRKPWAGSRSI